MISGDFLKKARKTSGLTQEEVSFYLKIAFSKIGQFERKGIDSDIRLKDLAALATLYELDLPSLVNQLITPEFLAEYRNIKHINIHYRRHNK